MCAVNQTYDSYTSHLTATSNPLHISKLFHLSKLIITARLNDGLVINDRALIKFVSRRDSITTLMNGITPTSGEQINRYRFQTDVTTVECRENPSDPEVAFGRPTRGTVMQIVPPYLMFLGDAPDALAAKTAIGVCEWRPEWCTGQMRLPACKADLGIADMSIKQAAEAGARTLLLGVANRGGVIPDDWQTYLIEALDAGMDIASGLHTKLTDLPRIREHANKTGRALFDVRHPTDTFSVASGVPRSGHRVLTVGTDCSVGKMYTSLALARNFEKRGIPSDFRATGQTGIFIDGRGISVDAVVADFISGSVEALSPANDADHWDMVEGQGSLFHPSFAGVTLGLIHGAQPDHMILCHEPTRTHMRGLPQQRVPSLEECIPAYESAARLVAPSAKISGVAINTRALSDEEANALLQETAVKIGLPCVDPVRTGVDPLADAILS